MVKYTTAYWLTPNGNSVNNVGIKPDIEIILDKTDEYQYETDNQLQGALNAVK